ncbi:hypothetical protein C2845_PM01G34450 [Panicum miliaceum]|uniref:CRC domain-containing protein n=1 Tax=Panicum miliaceum TaxID=4540 RepID=A0A3L6TMD5_PANMI|nr:hypothetical protein C2845_PM01G34450 [Panicum miliaceum]
MEAGWWGIPPVPGELRSIRPSQPAGRRRIRPHQTVGRCSGAGNRLLLMRRRSEASAEGVAGREGVAAPGVGRDVGVGAPTRQWRRQREDDVEIDSPVFDFINSLSPIAAPKPLGSTQNVQLFKSSDLVPASSIFTSPQVNPQKEYKSGTRDGYVQLSQGLGPNCQRNRIGISSCIELSGSPTIASENCSPSEYATILPSKWPQPIPLGNEILGDAKKQDTDGKADHSPDVGQVKLSSTCYDQNGVDQLDSSTSGRNVQENELTKQYNDDLAACSLNHLVSCSGNGNGVVSKSDLSLDAQRLSWELRSDVIFSKSFMPMPQGNLEDSRRELFDEPTGCYIQSAADDTHVYYAGAAEGVATNHDPQMLPGVIQSQLVSNEYFFGTFKVPSDSMALSEHQCGGMHRRSLFNEKVRTSDLSGQSGSNLHHTNICDDNYLKPSQSPVYALPGIGLHLNAVASNASNNMPFTINPPLPPEHNSPTTIVSCSETGLYSSEVNTLIHDDHSSQKTMPSADESCKESYKKKRRKLQKGDGGSCRRCSCKKSKCLKLYCACFAAKVYCSGLCSCQGCSNNHTHEELVSCIRKRTESRNPLAFAPTVTRACDSGSDFGSGVGCSMSCRCESCKNSFGKRKGLATEKMEKGAKAKGTRSKEEKLAFGKQDVASQSGDLPSTEDLFATPWLEPCRSSILLPSTCSEPPVSTTGCSSKLHNSQSPMKADVLLSPFETCAMEPILVDGSSNIQEVSSSCTTRVKVVSPNKKRVSPLQTGTGSSPIGRSGRKLVLKSIPSFPSLTGDADSEPSH